MLRIGDSRRSLGRREAHEKITVLAGLHRVLGGEGVQRRELFCLVIVSQVVDDFGHVVTRCRGWKSERSEVFDWGSPTERSRRPTTRHSFHTIGRVAVEPMDPRPRGLIADLGPGALPRRSDHRISTPLFTVFKSRATGPVSGVRSSDEARSKLRRIHHDDVAPNHGFAMVRSRTTPQEEANMQIAAVLSAVAAEYTAQEISATEFARQRPGARPPDVVFRSNYTPSWEPLRPLFTE